MTQTIVTSVMASAREHSDTIHWAGKYIGVEYGEGPGQFKCWSLIRAVYSDALGIELKDYRGVDIDDIGDALRAAREFKRDYTLPPWTQVTIAQDFDVVIMAGHVVRDGAAHRMPLHAGVVVGGRLLHIESHTDSVWVPLNHRSVEKRILTFCRHEQLVGWGLRAPR